MAAEHGLFQVGEDIGRYEIIAHLKSGGMATLYLGRRHPDNRIYAIKVVNPELAEDEQSIQMFLDEARLSSRINHPNVVRVEELGEAKDTYFLAMEYVHGCSLAQLLQGLIRKRRRMSSELAVHVAMSVCDALYAAHELRGDDGRLLNVVHRDVSPQNILLAHTGDIKLIDFGIAKSQARMAASLTGISIRGKLRYMSPEHARAESVDLRSDIYALGIVLWETLTMRPLFWANTDFELLMTVQSPNVVPPSHYSPRVSVQLDQVLMAALAPDRDDRPRSALDLRNMLSAAVPFAEALDHEQVAELLDAMLGDELGRAAGDIPQDASIEMGIESLPSSSATRLEVPQAVHILTAPEAESDAEDTTFSDVLALDYMGADPTLVQDSPIDHEGDGPTELMSLDALSSLGAEASAISMKTEPMARPLMLEDEYPPGVPAFVDTDEAPTSPRASGEHVLVDAPPPAHVVLEQARTRQPEQIDEPTSPTTPFQRAQHPVQGRAEPYYIEPEPPEDHLALVIAVAVAALLLLGIAILLW